MGKEKSAKPPCKFGDKCYRKNPKHLEEFRHPGDSEECESPPAKKKKTIDDFFKGPTKVKEKSDEEEDQSSNTTETSDTPDASEIEIAAATSKSGDEDVTHVEEEENEPDSPADMKENIKQKYLVEMPQDFFDFWELAKSIKPKEPCSAFRTSLGLHLVGPYDILAGKSQRKNKYGKIPCYARHWRYFYDPPEFLTVLRGDPKTQFHMGYFRDDPQEMPAFVASNAAKENCNFRPRGENLFAALGWFIDYTLKEDKSKQGELKALKIKITEFATKGDYSMEQNTKGMKGRQKKSVCPSFHGAGIVVPVDANEVGYREVPETNADLRKMFKKIHEAPSDDERNEAFDPLMELIMLVQFANDEGDYGEGLELGMAMFCFGSKYLHSSVLNMMPMAYELLHRNEFGTIIKEHLKDRKDGSDLSEFE